MVIRVAASCKIYLKFLRNKWLYHLIRACYCKSWKWIRFASDHFKISIWKSCRRVNHTTLANSATSSEGKFDKWVQLGRMLSRVFFIAFLTAPYFCYWLAKWYYKQMGQKCFLIVDRHRELYKWVHSANTPVSINLGIAKANSRQAALFG